MKSNNLSQLRLQAVLTEYQSLRAEMRQKFDNHLKIYSFTITVITLLLGYVIVQGKYDLLLAIPFFSVALTFRYIWEQTVIVMLGNYLKFIEANIIPEILGERDATNIPKERSFFLGWEHYFHDNFPSHPYYKYAIQVLFVFIPIGPAVIYSSLIIIRFIFNIDVILVSRLPIFIHIVASIFYILAGIYLSRQLWKS